MPLSILSTLTVGQAVLPTGKEGLPLQSEGQGRSMSYQGAHKLRSKGSQLHLQAEAACNSAENKKTKSRATSFISYPFQKPSPFRIIFGHYD